MEVVSENSSSQARELYVNRRKAHYEKMAARPQKSGTLGAGYQRQLQRYYQLFVPRNQRVLEIGCGNGDLLNAVAPEYGVGLDFSPAILEQARQNYPHLTFLEQDAHALSFDEPFDVIILSDLVNDLWDVQQVLTALKSCCHPATRLVLNFHNNLWGPMLSFARRLGLLDPQQEQNWLTPEDLEGLLKLSGFELVQRRPLILFPLNVPVLTRLFNRVLAHLPLVRAFDLTHFFIARPVPEPLSQPPSVTVVIPARNEAGNIKNLLERVPAMGASTEIIFVEGGSSDDTYAVIEKLLPDFPEQNGRLIRQTGQGKGDAVRAAFECATGDVLMILDADGTVAPEELPRFYDALVSGKGEFINGVRLVYPLGDRSMRFFNMVGNKFFGLLFSWLLGQPLRDTLCGTKVLWKKDYEQIAANRAYFGKLDPFGDFDLLFGAAKLNLKIQELPIRYGARTYGDTNISRWRHGVVLLRMAAKATAKLKLI
ncbi:glycosyltransferase [Pontiellaceae bacterium B12227]|nr:glycosyltransferase [Pontiellaceae bacterium B12227]